MQSLPCFLRLNPLFLTTSSSTFTQTVLPLLYTHITWQQAALLLSSGCQWRTLYFRSHSALSLLPILSLSPAPQHHRLPSTIHPRSSTGPAPCPAQQHSNTVVSVLWEQVGENLSFHPLKHLARVLKRSLWCRSSVPTFCSCISPTGLGDVLKDFTPLPQPQLWRQTCFGLARVLSHLSDTLGAPGGSVGAQAADSPSVPHLRWLMRWKKEPPSACVSEELMHSACLFPDRLRSCNCRPGGSREQKQGWSHGWWCPLQGTSPALGT